MSEPHEAEDTTPGEAAGEEATLAGAAPGDGGAPPETGDLVVDAALRDLAAVDGSDLDATLAAGEAVHETLTSRLSDLGT